MSTWNKLAALASLTLAVTACGPTKTGGGGGSADPSSVEGSEAKVGRKGAGGKFGSPTVEAKEAFDAVVAKYRSAKGDGSISSSECGPLSSEFWNIYEEYGEQLLVAGFNAGAVLEECGDRDKALSYYKKIEGRRLHLAINNIGVAEYRKGNTSAALSLFEKAVDADKMRAFAARNNLAAMTRDKYAVSPSDKDFDNAEFQLRNVLAVDSGNRVAYENLARLYYDRGRLKDPSYILLAKLVIEQANRLLKGRNERSAALANIRGLLFMQEQNQVDALRSFAQAVEIEPDDPDANLNIAFISIRFRDHALAEKSLAVALKHPSQKRNPEAYLAMGVAKRGLKNYKEAESFFNEAAKLDPRDPRPHFNLGVLYTDHIPSEEGGDVVKLEKYYNIAKGHFQKASGMATGAQWTGLNDDAKLRIYNIDEAITSIRTAEKLQKEAAALEAAAKKAEEEERKRLLELEAAASASSDSGTPAPSTPAPATPAATPPKPAPAPAPAPAKKK